MSLFSGMRDVIESILRPAALEPSNPGDGLTLFLKEAMPLCRLCGKVTGGHLYQQVASVVFKDGNSRTIERFLKAYEHNQWNELSQFQEWNGSLDNGVAWLFQCPDGRHHLAVFHDPNELWDTASVLRHKEIDVTGFPIAQSGWLRIGSGSSFDDQ